MKEGIYNRSKSLSDTYSSVVVLYYYIPSEDETLFMYVRSINKVLDIVIHDNITND